MMTRVSLAHTGRTLFADPTAPVIYAAVLVAALVRIRATAMNTWRAAVAAG